MGHRLSCIRISGSQSGKWYDGHEANNPLVNEAVLLKGDDYPWSDTAIQRMDSLIGLFAKYFFNAENRITTTKPSNVRGQQTLAKDYHSQPPAIPLRNRYNFGFARNVSLMNALWKSRCANILP